MDRGEGDIEAVKNALKAIKSGDNLLIFPEAPGGARGGPARQGRRGRHRHPVRGLFVPVYVEGHKRPFHRTRIIFGEAYRPEVSSRRPPAEEVQAVANEVLRRAYALGRDRT